MTAGPNNAHLQPGVIAEFDSARATPRQIAASFTLDQTVPHDQPGQVSLRFIYMSIIGEHARHAEHADRHPPGAKLDAEGQAIRLNSPGHNWQRIAAVT